MGENASAVIFWPSSDCKSRCSSHLWPSVFCALLSSSPSNIQLSRMNISPSSVLIFLIPTGFSLCSLSCTSKLLFTCISSSGKYFMCLGRSYGHAGSERTGEAHRISRSAEGRERTLVGDCIGDKCCWGIAQKYFKKYVRRVS
jgi:hypothetical protein